jgi:hypothetical protein
MSQVYTGVLEKLQDLLPGQIGTNRRWSTEAVERHIALADRAVRERIENYETYQDITLQAGVRVYNLDSTFIDVFAVEYAADGATFDHDVLPATFEDFDRLSIRWRDDGGTKPEFYTLLSAPGTPSSQILIHRPMTSVDGTETLRVWGHHRGDDWYDDATNGQYQPDDIQMSCHVPYVMAILVAGEDASAASQWYDRFLSGIDKVSRRTVSRYSQGSRNSRVGY